MPGADQRLVDRVDHEHLAGVGPESSSAACIRRWLSSVPSPRRIDQVAGALEVIGDLLRGLARRSRRCAGRASAASALQQRAGARRRTGTGASACRRSRRSAARPAAGCGSRGRRAGRRASSSRPVPSTSPARPSHIRAWPIRSSATLASAMSSSSDRAVAAPFAPGAARGSAACRPGAAGIRSSRAIAWSHVSASHVLHFVGDREERRMPVDLAVRRLEQRALVRRAARR